MHREKRIKCARSPLFVENHLPGIWQVRMRELQNGSLNDIKHVNFIQCLYVFPHYSCSTINCIFLALEERAACIFLIKESASLCFLKRTSFYIFSIRIETKNSNNNNNINNKNNNHNNDKTVFVFMKLVLRKTSLFHSSLFLKFKEWNNLIMKKLQLKWKINYSTCFLFYIIVLGRYKNLNPPSQNKVQNYANHSFVLTVNVTNSSEYFYLFNTRDVLQAYMWFS